MITKEYINDFHCSHQKTCVAGHLDQNAKLLPNLSPEMAEVKMQDGSVKRFPVTYNTEGTHPCWKIQDRNFADNFDFINN